MTCRDLLRALDPYVDGELEAGHVLTIEQHLAACTTCGERARLLRAMKRGARSPESDMASSALRARIAQSAAALHSVESRARHEARPPSWRSAIPWAAAAAIAIGIGGGIRLMGAASAQSVAPQAGGDSLAASVAQIPLLDVLAAHHAQPLPPEEVDPARITRVFSPIVGVPVRPSQLEGMQHRPGYQFAGARLLSIRGSTAATLFYNFGPNRVTVFVFDPDRISLRSSCCVVRHVVTASGQTRRVLLGRAKGYPVAVFERDGVGYAVSSDLGEPEVMSIASSM